RHGENAMNVIRRIKDKLAEIQPTLPPGVEVVTTYDRSDLITRAIDTLKHELTVQMIIVALVILLFLWHSPSWMLPIGTMPLAVLIAFSAMALLGIAVNIMALAGIAISIGVLVDGSIIEGENAYNRLYRWQAEGRRGNYRDALLRAMQEVGP